MKEKEYILQCEFLTKVYGTQYNLVTACNEINLKFEKEKVYSIVGPSGSGKSTLLHLLGGLEKPTSGKVIYRGENIFSMHEMQLASYRRRNCGFVFQNLHITIIIVTHDHNIASQTDKVIQIMDGKLKCPVS